MPTSPIISVIICTRNRAACLKQALDSLASQDFPADRFEILVIDNASSDSTAEVAQAFRRRHHGIASQYIHEPVLGLSKARNTGLTAATGDIAAYLDDDAIALPGWLAAIAEAFATPAPAPGCVGGRVEPIWEKPRPAWLADELLAYLTILDLGPEPLRLGPAQYVVGANMAFDRTLLITIGGFPEHLGRQGGNLLSNEEIIVRRAVDAQGSWCRYFPAMQVRHLAPADRLNKRWFLRRSFWQGVSNQIMANSLPKSPAPAGQGRRRTTSPIVTQARNLFYFLAPATDPRIFSEKCRIWARLGKLAVRSGLYHFCQRPANPHPRPGGNNTTGSTGA